MVESALRLSVNAAVNQPEALATWTLATFADLAAELTRAAGPGTKDDSDLLVAVAEWTELRREAGNAKVMARLFIADIDGRADADIDALLGALQGTEIIVYSTHSHRTPRKHGLNCYRVLIALDREYSPGQFHRLWDAVNRRLLGMLDPTGRSPEHAYYLPAYPPEYRHVSECWRQEGAAWSVDELLAEAGPGSQDTLAPPPTSTPVAQGNAPSSVAMLAQLSSWVRNQQDPERKAVGTAGRDILNGKVGIQPGKGLRNAFLIKLAGYLAHVWPLAPAAGIVEHFRTVGWDLFNPDGKYPLTAFAEMVERLQVREHAALAEAQRAGAAERADAIRRATAGARDTPTSDAEVAALTDVFGPTWQQHLLGIHKRDLYFLRPDGTYDPGPVMRDTLFVAARDRLAVFGGHVEYSYEDERGAHRKTDKAFLEEYGTVVRAVVWDMSYTRGAYEPKTETIVFPAATPIVEPVAHEDVHAWLETLGERLIDMLACMPRFDLMLPALVLTGPASSGKTILAKGIGQIYGSDPLDAEVAFDHYNATWLTKQPIVFMDEKVSDAYRKEGTTLVRRFLTCSSRVLDEKYQAKVELRGFARLIIAANNLDVLNTSEEMSAEDREAFAERLVHIDCAPALAYLETIGRERIQRDWLNGRAIAEHVRWLAQNWVVRNVGRRFAVGSNHTRLHEGLASRSGFAGDVAYWLLSYLASPERATAAHLPLELDRDHCRLRVNSAALVQGWGHYLKDHRPPSPTQISRALRSLSTGARQKILIGSNGTSRRLDAYEIDPRLLRTANDQHRLVDDFDRVFGLTDVAN